MTPILTVPAFTERAACTPDDDAALFPASAGPLAAHAGKAICARCPVSAACLEYALATDHLGAYGIWGGLSASERDQLRRRGGAA